jgi:hypothetical protein
MWGYAEGNKTAVAVVVVVVVLAAIGFFVRKLWRGRGR